MEIMQKLGSFEIHIDRFLTLREANGNVYEVTLYVKSLEYLNKIFLELNKLSYVDKVERLMR